MIEIDGLKIKNDNGFITVTFPGGKWTGEGLIVTNILLYEILNHMDAVGDKVVSDTSPTEAVIKHQTFILPEKNKRGRTKA